MVRVSRDPRLGIPATAKLCEFETFRTPLGRSGLPGFQEEVWGGLKGRERRPTVGPGKFL